MTVWTAGEGAGTLARVLAPSGQPPSVSNVSENHLSEVEKTLLYISEARERAGRARTVLESSDAEPHLIAALKATEQTLADEHKKLMQRTFFAVQSGDQECLAV